MSYHLRLLAGHDFVREVTGRGQGRERWWEVSPQPVWIPREGLSIQAQAEVSGLRPAFIDGRRPGRFTPMTGQNQIMQRACGIPGACTSAPSDHRGTPTYTGRIPAYSQ